MTSTVIKDKIKEALHKTILMILKNLKITIVNLIIIKLRRVTSQLTPITRAGTTTIILKIPKIIRVQKIKLFIQKIIIIRVIILKEKNMEIRLDL